MICSSCQSIFPNHYTACPACNSTEFSRERFAPQQLEIVEVEPISADVVTSGFEIGEIDE